MDKELLDRIGEMFEEHYKGGIMTGIGYSAIVMWCILFAIVLIMSIGNGSLL